MTADAKPPGIERRSRERVADDADWETKVLARVRGKLKRVPDQDGAAGDNWEEQVAAAVKSGRDKPGNE